VKTNPSTAVAAGHHHPDQNASMRQLPFVTLVLLG
jgi:hypothetical protein